MQPFFKSAFGCIEGVLYQIKLAIKRNAGIVILEYEDCGATIPEIVDVLKPYKRKSYIKKCRDDGSREFMSVAKRRKFSYDRVRLVGVNRHACVADTAEGLAKRYNVQVEVAMNATWDSYPKAGRKALNESQYVKKIVNHGKIRPGKKSRALKRVK